MPNKVRTIFEDFAKKNSTVKLAGLYFARHYQILWIAKWDYSIGGKNDERHGETLRFLPILGRRHMVKWWDKFDFFSDKGIYHVHKIYQVISPPVSYAEKTAEASLKRLLAAVGKDEFMAKIASMLNEDTAESSTNQQTSADSDDTMPDSQNP